MSRQSIKPRFPAENYLNRELGLLAFNRRVLAQAQDERVPLLERLRFLCIVSSNMDEFFEIRMSGLKEQIKANAPGVSTDGKTPQESFRLVSAEAHALVAEQYRRPERGHPAADGGTGHPLPAPLEMDRCPARVDSRLFLPRNGAGTDADRTRSLASLPEGPQQEPQFCRRTRRQGRLRAQFQRRHRPGAARPAARHPDALRKLPAANTASSSCRRSCTSSSANCSPA